MKNIAVFGLTVFLMFYCASLYSQGNDNRDISAQNESSQTLDIEKKELAFAPENTLEFRENDNVGVSLFFNIIFTIVLLSAVLYGALIYLKKKGVLGLPVESDVSGSIKTISIKRLGGKTLLNVIEIDGSRMLICHNDHAITIEKLDQEKRFTIPD